MIFTATPQPAYPAIRGTSNSINKQNQFEFISETPIGNETLPNDYSINDGPYSFVENH